MTAPNPTRRAAFSLSSRVGFLSMMITLASSIARCRTSSRKIVRPSRVDMRPSWKWIRPKGICTQSWAQEKPNNSKILKSC